MSKSEINDQIINLIEKNIEKRHRSIFILMGENGINQIPKFFYLLTQYSKDKEPNILWIYKKNISEQISKKKSDSFYDTVDISKVYYEESDRVLGNTYKMLVIEDYEGITPNILAQIIETVKGGGIIIILLKKDIDKYEMDVYNKYGCKEEIVPRFNKRLYKSLIDVKFTMIIDENLEILSYKPSKKINKQVIDSKINNEVINNKINNEVLNSKILNKMAVNEEQDKIITKFKEILNNKTGDKKIISLTAARGRGKSAILGLTIANAIHLGYSKIKISSPRIENVRTLFNFIVKGLIFLGYKNLEINYYLSKRNINKITISRQTIEYLDPNDEGYVISDMLIIDEAAAIPLINLKRLLTANLTFIASTVNGYEGTGRVLSTKLFNELRELSKSEEPFEFEEIKIEEPIRYARNDPIEKWLNKILILDCEIKKLQEFPAPNECNLFCINRDLLFSFHSYSECFLKELISLFVASHYKNSPNDIQLMSDAPNHSIFVLLTPKSYDVICAIQIAFEGKNKKRNGNLIPWILSEKCFKKEYLDKIGVRIVRIAVHPNYLSMGYGTRALELLEKIFENGMEKIKENLEYKKLENDENPLLYCLDEIRVKKIEWVGVSINLDLNQLKFWLKNKFKPIYLQHNINPITGEFEMIMIQGLTNSILNLNIEFKINLILLLSYNFKDIHHSITLRLLNNPVINNTEIKDKPQFSKINLERLECYKSNLINLESIIDIIFQLSEFYFLGVIRTELSMLEKAILLMVGLQRRIIVNVSKILNITEKDCLLVFHKLILKLYNTLMKDK